MQNIKYLGLFLISSLLVAVENIDAGTHGFYLGLELGESAANYTNAQLSNNISAKSINTTGFSERVYIGYGFTSWLAAELNVNYFARPKFNNLAGSGVSPQIKNNVISLVAKVSHPVVYKLRLDLLGGLGYVARSSIVFNGVTILPQNIYFTPVYGAGLSYPICRRWVVEATWLQAPANSHDRLPVSNFFGAGAYFRFNV